MNIKLLRFITRLENVFCVYRNFCLFSAIGRTFICLQILIFIGLAFFCIAYYALYALDFCKFVIIYITLSTGTSVIISLISIFRSRDYLKLMNLIDVNHEFFSKDSVYLQRIDKTHVIVTSVTIVYLIFSFGSTILFNILEVSEVNIFVYRIYTFNMGLCCLRYSSEYIVLYTLLFLLSEQVKCITRKISRDRHLVSFESEEYNDDSNTGYDVTEDMKNFEEWTEAYTKIKECSKLINSIFGIQITLMLTALTYYFIMFLYMMAYMGVYYGTYRVVDVLVYFLKIISFFIALYALSRSAQTAQNSVIHLRRRLGKLLLLSISDEKTYRTAKDFLHLVTIRPIKTQAFGFINVDMTLVPKFVMFFTSYTIIALQFNNVL